MKSHNQSILSARWRQRPKRDVISALATFPLSFGRYRNVPLARIPASYLRWLVKAENVPEADRWAALRYLKAIPAPRGRRSERRHSSGRIQKTTASSAAAIGAGP
jgi:uncharacterized protein (DUF3820 family)